MKRSTIAIGAPLLAIALAAVAAQAEAPVNPADPNPAAPSPVDPRPAASARVIGTAMPVPADATDLDADVPSVEKSSAPTAPEWLAAKPVKLTRRGKHADSCVATRVREWIRVRCHRPTFAISLLGGSNEGLAFWIGGEAEGRFGEVQLPMRRGDRRVVQLWESEPDHTGAAVTSPSLVLQELWPDGDAAPTVTVL